MWALSPFRGTLGTLRVITYKLNGRYTKIPEFREMRLPTVLTLDPRALELKCVLTSARQGVKECEKHWKLAYT